MRTAGVTYPSIYDPGGSALLAFTGKIGPRSIPSTMVLDRQGRIAALILGAVPSRRPMLDVVEDVVAEEAPGG